MADLGSKGLDPSPTICSRVIVSPAVYKRSTNADTNELQIDTSGVISGVVRVATVVTAGVRVGLFHRSNMQQIAMAVTDNVGAYVFRDLDKTDLQNYFVVILDPNAASPWNYSLVRDHLTAG